MKKRGGMNWEQNVEKLTISNFEKRIVRTLCKMLAKPHRVEINYSTLNGVSFLLAVGLFIFAIYTFITQALFAFSFPLVSLITIFASLFLSFVAMYVAVACKMLAKTTRDRKNG